MGLLRLTVPVPVSTQAKPTPRPGGARWRGRPEGASQGYLPGGQGPATWAFDRRVARVAPSRDRDIRLETHNVGLFRHPPKARFIDFL